MTNADRSETPAVVARYLVVSLEGRLYALPADLIAEVLRTPAAARVPHAPRALLGVANLRGTVMPLVSLRGLLGIAETDQGGLRSIVLSGDAPIAISVDAVESLTTVDVADVQNRTTNLAAEYGECLIGAFSSGDGRGMVKILDIQALLSDAFAGRDRSPRRTSESSALVGRARAEAAVPSETLVTFAIADQEFALHLAAVQEVVSLPEQIAAAPRADSSVLGVMAYRDRLLPLLSLRALLGFDALGSEGGREKVVVATVGATSIGLVADRARAIISADPGLIEPAPAILTARMRGEARVKSIYRADGSRRLVSISSSGAASPGGCHASPE